MAAMLKKFLAVVAGIALGASVGAADVELKSDHPDTYTVVKGDTLWDISAKFLQKPWLWPEIWQANPQIKNPHWIYPGDQLTLVYVEGRPTLVSSRSESRDGRLSPRARPEPLDGAVTAISLGEVQPFLTRTRMLTEDEAFSLPYVVAIEENQPLGTQGQLAYVRGLRENPGTAVVIVRPTVVYYDPPEWGNEVYEIEAEPWSSERGRTVAKWWNQSVSLHRSRHRSTDVLGFEVLEIGTGELLRGGDPSTVLLRTSDMEIHRGDLVMPATSVPFDLTFHPHAPKAEPDNMRVVALVPVGPAAHFYMGPHQVVALSRGAQDGVENGQVYSLYQPGEVIRDRVMYPDSHDWRTTFSDRKAQVQLPEEYVGHVMVFRTFDRISYGLIMDALKPVSLHNVAHVPD
jgi:hypothetical protein